MAVDSTDPPPVRDDWRAAWILTAAGPTTAQLRNGEAHEIIDGVNACKVRKMDFVGA